MAAALSLFYFNQQLFIHVLLSIFPYKFLTVAYTTMIYNEIRYKNYWIQLIFRNKFSEKKNRRKMSKNPNYRTLQVVNLGLLQSCYCSNQRQSYFYLLEQHRGTSAGNYDVENSSKNNHMLMKNKPTKWIPFREVYT